jgi:phosphatidylglycerol:prolipoprotein diacylglycerol transferase
LVPAHDVSEFDPVALQIDPLRSAGARSPTSRHPARLALLHLATQLPPQRVSRTQLDDLMVWVTVGIILGGRLGQVLLWAPGYYLANPLEILMIWKGGMAFHGGLLGVIVAILLYARSQKLSPSPSPM